tara:strand:- start:377 stop:643 length:267 start_codon:yes stop_codon:yes gene_type:complete
MRDVEMDRERGREHVLSKYASKEASPFGRERDGEKESGEGGRGKERETLRLVSYWSALCGIISQRDIERERERERQRETERCTTVIAI